jgi:hypothetical protein
MKQLAQQWLSKQPCDTLYGFLKLSFAQLHQQHGGVYGMRIPHPKIIAAATRRRPV